jgi:hypothetical protein
MPFMPYDTADPRTKLAAPTSSRGGVPRAAQYRELHNGPADEQHPGGSQTWWMRSQTAVVGYTEASAGEILAFDTADECVLLVLDPTMTVQIDTTMGQTKRQTTVMEPAVVMVPPGATTVTATTAGTLVRLFTATGTTDLAAKCSNAAAYATADPNVPTFTAWPDPTDGPRVRVYPFAQFPLQPGMLGRIFRCSTFMVNVFGSNEPPRDPTKLSPHHHDDFEQISLQLRGNYVHHMRVPWTPDLSTWRDDEHQACVSPAIVVIPPPLVHTSQSVDPGAHWLIDVFAPPRVDFSNQPGWVRNAHEYPMPT